VPKSRTKVIESTDLLLVIDLQRDFCPGGTLPVPDGNAVVPLINQLGRRFGHVILTQDWHPRGHRSFASSYPGKSPFDQVTVEYGQQTLWPDHCVQGTPGADFHPDLDIPHAELILRKGFRREIDSYSAFLENDKQTPTGLAGYLRERGFQRIFLAGLAYDYCVRFSAIDAAHNGFEAIVIEDACRAIGPVSETEQEFARTGVKRITVAEMLQTGE
jgi:nicotinamidase/pyrazinamidase